MGLDVYVMPIWKFKARDFSSPLQAFGMTPVIVAPHGMRRGYRRGQPGAVTRWKAKRATRRLRHEIEAEIGHPVGWNDDGDVAYARQAQGFEPLQAFAKWLDYRDLYPTFDPPPENNYYEHPVMSEKRTRPLTYPQLVDHSCHSGYFVPSDLERVVYVEPFSSWGGFVFMHSVGSSHRLHAELERLAQVLCIDEHWEGAPSEPLADVKAAFAQLREMTKISCAKDLPIVFYG